MPRPVFAFALAACVATPVLANETITYSYDVNGHLVKVVHAGTVNNGVTVVYCVDKADNWTVKKPSGTCP